MGSILTNAAALQGVGWCKYLSWYSADVAYQPSQMSVQTGWEVSLDQPEYDAG